MITRASSIRKCEATTSVFLAVLAMSASCSKPRETEWTTLTSYSESTESTRSIQPEPSRDSDVEDDSKETEGSRPPALDRKIEPRRTIPHGIYGQTTEQDDVGPPRPPRAYSMAVSIFRAGKRTKPIAETTSDEDGFYQIALEAGSYEACTSFRRCRSFRVAPGECVRLDYEFSVGPGWSLPTSEPCGADPP